MIPKKKSEIIFNKLLKDDIFIYRNKRKRSNSYEIYGISNIKHISFESKNKKGIIKKLVNLEKKYQKLINKKSKNKIKKKNKNKKDNNKLKKEKEVIAIIIKI